MSLKDWLTKNIYVTTPHNADPFFRPRKYAKTKEEVAGTVQEILRALTGWKVVEYRENQGRVHATHTAPIIPYTEDVNIYIVQGLDGITKLEVISQSQTVKVDFGQNKRNIKKLLSALDSKLTPQQ